MSNFIRLSRFKQALFTSLFLAFSLNAWAGIPTIDPASIAQSIIMTLKQIEQYKTQLKQYEDRLKNSKNPKDFVWSDLGQTLKDLKAKEQELFELQKLIGDAASFGEFKTAQDFADNPCLQPGNAKNCNEEELQKLADINQQNKDVEQKSITNAYKLSIEATKDVQSDTVKLQQLQKKAQDATGANEIAQINNQIVALQTKQLLRKNELLTEQIRVQAIKDKLEQERRTKSLVVSNKRFGYSSGDFDVTDNDMNNAW